MLIATCLLDVYPDIQISDPIRALKSQFRALESEKGALEEEIATLGGFGKNMAKMPDLTPGNASAFSDTLFEKTLSNSAAVLELKEKIERIEQQIGKLKEAKAGTTDAKAVVTIVANEAGPAQLRLTYREPHATYSETPHRPPLSKVWTTAPTGVHFTTCMRIRTTENHPHLSPYTTG